MKKSKKYSLLPAVLVTFMACFFSAGPAMGQTPDELEKDFAPAYGPWKLNPQFQSYNGEDLYNYIDGAADSYLAYDFNRLLVGTYEIGSDQYITVEIYQQGSPLQAFGIYSQERPQKGHFVKVGTQGYQEGSMLNFLSGRYYVKISSHQEDNQTQQVIMKIAEDLASKLSGDSRFPAELSLFPAQGKIENSENYIHVSFLSYEFLNSAFTCIYKQSDKTFKLFIIHAADKDGAEKMMTDYLQFSKQEFNGTEGKYVVNDPYNGKIPLIWKGSYIWGLIDDQQANPDNGYLETIQDNISKIR